MAMDRSITEIGKLRLSANLERFRQMRDTDSEKDAYVQIVDKFKSAGIDELESLNLCLNLGHGAFCDSKQPKKYILSTRHFLMMIKMHGPLEAYERLWMIAEALKLYMKAFKDWNAYMVGDEEKQPDDVKPVIKSLSVEKSLDAATEAFVAYKLKYE